MFRKSLIFIVCMLVLGGTVFGAYSKKEADVKKNPQDVLDFFLILPKALLDPYIGGLSFKDRLAYINDSVNKKVTVDIPNGYLSISAFIDDTSVIQSIAHFTKSDKTKIIGVVREWESGVCGMMWDYKFYEYKKGKFTDVTSKILPKLTIDLFCADSDKKTVTAKMNKAMKYKLDLPQFGTVCDVYPAGICETDNGLTPGEYELYLDIEKNFQYTRLELKWNKQTGKFEFGKKYKGGSKNY